jgi:hypothetical protein
MTRILEQFPIDDLKSKLAAIPDLEVGAAMLPQKLLPVPLSTSRSFEIDELKLATNLDGELSVEVFNSKDDDDELGVFGGPDADAPPSDLGPVLAPGGCWLKYGVSGAGKASGAVSVSNQGLSFDLSLGVDLADYRAHAPTERVRTVLETDLLGLPRFAFFLAQVKGLGVGDALAMRVGGKLGLGVELAWSDAFTQGLGEATRILSVTGPLSVSIEAGAKVQAEVSVQDEFLLVFSRPSEQQFRLGVRKALSHRIAVSGSASVTAAIKGLDAGVVGRFADAISERAKIEPLLDRLTSLSPLERELLARLAERLGVALEESDAVQRIRARIQQVQDGAEVALKVLATNKIVAGFSYEYARVGERIELLSALLSPAALEKHHAKVVSGRLGGVLDDLRAGIPGLVLDRYLNEQAVTSTKAWGFSLGLKKWELSGKDGETLKKVVRRSLDRTREQRAYQGVRTYRSKWVDDERELIVDFRADMKGLSVRDVPLVNEFTFGLALSWGSFQKVLGKTELGEALDTAVLWGVLPQSDADRLALELQSTHVGKDARFVAQLALGDELVKPLMDLAGKHTPAELLAPALAGALPPWGDREERRTLQRRIDVYRSSWLDYLDRQDPPLDALTKIPDFWLRKQGLVDMAQREVIQAAHGASWKSVVQQSGGTTLEAARFHHALAQLGRDLASGAPDRGAIEGAFENMQSFWSQSLHLRALGLYCQHGLNVLGLRGRARASLTITSGGKDLVIGR